MKRTLVALFALWPALAQAHFGLILPDDPMITQEEGREVALTFGFVHPFEQFGMEMEPPVRVIARTPGGTEDITESLSPGQVLGGLGYRTDYRLTRPGAYVFAMEPQPYWEPGEDKYILHYSKTVLSAFDGDAGWQEPLGVKTEIVPLTRPFGLWAGNIFRGQVLRDGAPVPLAEVEVEYYNREGRQAPAEVMITQTIRADEFGVFTYAPPGAGWWGFAALTEADYTIARAGAEKPVELGAVIWVHFEPWD